MSSPDEIEAIIQSHFEQVDPALFEMQIAQSVRGELVPIRGSDEYLDKLGLPSHGLIDPSMSAGLKLVTGDVKLNAYLACALTGLNDAQREHIFLLSDTLAGICESHGIEVYQPRKHTDPNQNPDIADYVVFETDRNKVVGSDLLIVLAHHPSFGTGQELDFAYNALVPILVISPAKLKVSRMVKGIPGLVVKVEYTEPEELRIEFGKRLEEILPYLRQRRALFAARESNVVGDRIRQARENAGISRAELASSSEPFFPFTVEQLTAWEEAPDALSNLSLIQLRELAVLLKVRLAELVEPNLDALYLSFVNDLLDESTERTAARWARTSTEDRKRLVHRLLERFGVELGVDD